MKNLTSNEIVSIRLLLSIEGLGPARILNLQRTFPTINELFCASPKELTKAELINIDLANKIIKAYSKIDVEKASFDRELAKLEKIKARIVTYWDDAYPELLKKIYYPPLILYYIGDINIEHQTLLAIVGTRTPTNYGKNLADRFATELSNRGIKIVSGLARGIDSIAHESTIKSGGKTIAVIGSGLDVIYPPENSRLFKKICETGCVITEFPLGTKPDAPNFPKRNRIIAGISQGTLVIETRANGGAVQTAAHALNQNREVFAIPGNIGTAQSEGTNLLIQRGEAKLTIEPEDVLFELDYDSPKLKQKRNYVEMDLNIFEQKILETLNEEPLHIDSLSIKVGMSTNECLANLLQMEFKGVVKQLPGKMFIATY